MRSHSYSYMLRGLYKQIDRERKERHRNVISRGRAIESDIDLTQLPTRSATTLVDSDGVFWFLPGYSLVGGADKVRP